MHFWFQFHVLHQQEPPKTQALSRRWTNYCLLLQHWLHSWNLVAQVTFENIFSNQLKHIYLNMIQLPYHLENILSPVVVHFHHLVTVLTMSTTCQEQKWVNWNQVRRERLSLICCYAWIFKVPWATAKKECDDLQLKLLSIETEYERDILVPLIGKLFT